MAVAGFHLMSALSPKEVLRVLTDSGPSRTDVWPTIDPRIFKVHSLGTTGPK